MSAGAPRKVVAVRDYHGAMRVALAGLVAGLAIVAAGCGGSENGATAEPVSAHVGGAAAVSPANASVYAALDTSSGSDQWQQLRKLRGGDDSGFKNAVADLQGDALVTVYARPGGLTRALGSVGPGPVAATVSVEHDGLHVEGIAHTAEAHAAYAPKLFDRVPADAAAAVSLEGVHGLLASLGT